MNYLLPVIVVIFLLFAMTLSRRNRARALEQQQQQREEIRFGTEVVTMSGLYGTVVGINDDDTVQLSIAPGVEVKWVLAALRDVATLPQNVTPANPDEPPADHAGGAAEDPSEPPNN